MGVSLHRDRLVRVVRAEVLVHLNKLGNCQNLAIILFIINHMGPEHASREKKLSMVNFLIFVQMNIYKIPSEMEVAPRYNC